MMDGWMDGSQKSSLILLFFFSDEVQVILMCGNLENLRKTFFIREKSNFNIQKVGVFVRKKRFSDFSQNFVRCNSVGIKLFLFRKFVTSFFRIGQKSDFVRKKLNFWFNISLGCLYVYII